MKKTVFIVGAGASKDFGMPLGIELAADIRSVLQSEIGKPYSSSNCRVMTSAGKSGLPGDLHVAALDLCGGLISARSIDRLLDSRKNRPLVVELGKCAIAESIGRKERQSPIGARADDGQWSSLQSALLDSNDSWLAQLFGFLHERTPPAKAERVFASCSFITFNYDRCIERYLQLAFQQSMNRSAEDATALVSAIPIVHVYGSLGDLPNNGEGGVPFGAQSGYIRTAATSIRTFTEGVLPDIIIKIYELIKKAELIVFLGFAFDPINVNVLFWGNSLDMQTISGTRIGLSDSILSRAQSKILRDQIIVDSKGEAVLGTPGKLKSLLHPVFCNELVNDDNFRDHLFS
jgi:hypothetical protein